MRAGDGGGYGSFAKVEPLLCKAQAKAGRAGGGEAAGAGGDVTRATGLQSKASVAKGGGNAAASDGICILTQAGKAVPPAAASPSPPHPQCFCQTQALGRFACEVTRG